MRKTRAAGLLASLALAAGLAACGSPRGGQAVLPLCSTGHGSDGSTSTLAIRQHGSAFTGTYLTSPAGDPNEALRYAVTGTALTEAMTSMDHLARYCVEALEALSLPPVE